MTSIRKPLTQSERRAESARRLMDAAIELIAEKGFEKTSAAEIANRAGYSHGMVTARYGSKEALLERLMREEYEPRMLPPNDGPTSGLLRMFEWVTQIRQEIVTNPTLFRAFWTLIYEGAGPIPSLRPWTTDWLERCREEAQTCIETAQRDGDLPETVDARSEAKLFIYGGVGFGFRCVLDSNMDAFAEVLDVWESRLSRLASDAQPTP